MGLIERLAEPAPKPATKTRLDIWLDTLPDTEHNAVLSAVTDPAWGHVRLLEVLMSEGMPEVSDTAFRAWRRKRGLA